MGASEVKYTFYAVGADPSVDQFFAVILKGFEAAEAVFPVDVVYLGMMPEQINATGMVNLLQTAFAAEPDGVTSGFWFAAAQDEVVRAMLDAGIPVIAYNQEDLRDDPVPYLGYVGQDETVTGQKLARAAMERIDVERALIGIHAPGAASVETRAQGIVQVLEEEGIPFDKLDITMTPSTAITVMGAYLIQHPDTNVMFLLGPTGTHPALTLLEEQGFKGKVFIATCDSSDKTMGGIRDGTILVTIVQQPFMQSFTAIQLLYLYKEYGVVPPERIETGPTVIDKTNLEAVEKQIEETGGA
jgi:simple sugar transport system substrate-binding protein